MLSVIARRQAGWRTISVRVWRRDGQLRGRVLPPAAAPASTGPARDDLAASAPGSAARAHAADLRHRHPVLHAAARLVGVRTAARSFAIGARGERVVGGKLNRWAAAADWQVLHAVPVGHRGTDIDHVIIGPFGLVTVNTSPPGCEAGVRGRRMAGAGPVGHRVRQRAPVHGAARRTRGCCRAALAPGPAPMAAQAAVCAEPWSGRRDLRRRPASRHLAGAPPPPVRGVSRPGRGARKPGWPRSPWPAPAPTRRSARPLPGPTVRDPG